MNYEQYLTLFPFVYLAISFCFSLFYYWRDKKKCLSSAALIGIFWPAVCTILVIVLFVCVFEFAVYTYYDWLYRLRKGKRRKKLTRT